MSINLDALQQALASATEPTPVPLGDKTVRVLPPMDWRQSAMYAVSSGDFGTWAQKCLVNDLDTSGAEPTGSDDYATWLDVDPTNRQVAEFFIAYQQVAGQAPGK